MAVLLLGNSVAFTACTSMYLTADALGLCTLLGIYRSGVASALAKSHGRSRSPTVILWPLSSFFAPPTHTLTHAVTRSKR